MLNSDGEEDEDEEEEEEEDTMQTFSAARLEGPSLTYQKPQPITNHLD